MRGLSAEGADEIVQPEFEAGLEFVRQVLGWQGIDAIATEDLVAARRQSVYGAKAVAENEARSRGAAERPAGDLIRESGTGSAT